MELYFADLDTARAFYAGTVGLALAEDGRGHHAKFATDGGFVCLERRGVEDYPSADKAVLFIEVSDLRKVVARIGLERFAKYERHGARPWAVLPDPEGHTILFLQAPRGRGAAKRRPSARRRA